MAGRNYDRLTIEEFGKHLLDSNDLDPIYVALNGLLNDGAQEAPWTREQVQRWLVAYWCYYHAGVACWMCQYEEDVFWDEMMVAALNEKAAPAGGRWPRGHERRHFRGQAAVRAIEALRTAYPEPEQMVEYIVGPAPQTEHRRFEDVAKRAKEHRLFGPWIAFKVGDMVERVLGIPVDFSEAHVFMFKDPARAATMLYRQRAGIPETARIKNVPDAIHQVVDYLKNHFKAYKAPPRYDRPVDLQEVETILCCWKSHMNGHYPLYNDIDDINDGLLTWKSTVQTAAEFLSYMPRRDN